MINTILIVLEMLVASIVIIMTKPLDAIHGGISKKPLYFLEILSYILVSMLIVGVSFYVDGPINSIIKNTKLLNSWQSIDDYQMLSNVSI